jgi:hypothetical protein
MTPAGTRVYEARKTNHPLYSYEHGQLVPLSPEFLARFKRHRKAWNYFHAQRPSYRNPCTRWVMTAKREDTRQKRLELLIEHSAKSEWIPAMRWGKKA